MRKISFPDGSDEILTRYGISRDQVTPVSFQKGETILEQGYPVPALYFVVSGTTRIQTYSVDGRLLSFGGAGRGSAFGEMELLLGEENSYNTVLVLTKTICLALPFPVAKSLVHTNATLAYQLGHNAAIIWWHRNKNYVSALSADALTRLCSFLLQNEDNDVIRVPLTEITYAISTSYRHLMRLIRSLTEEGILEKKGKYYCIVNRDELVLLSQV
ncbi:MAG: cyclic nucleotide-binding domain-containing protein [Oscillospiraceae bacterium]|nr:cyclic nucleotide-binding domain-containing protein [Oscillospiraceae bacterium]